MKRNIIVLSFLLLVTSVIFGQNDNKVLFTVKGKPTTVAEFKRVYQKNINLVQNENQKDVDQYLKLYVNYKLKLAEAKSLGLDEKPKYINELKSYRSQLAEKYLTDTNINDQLIQEAYNRILEEVNVNHILVKCPENADPKDTLEAYSKVLSFRKQALKNGFEKTMSAVSNSKTVLGESIGYFDAFKTVYPFENAAYATEKNEISMPFRTQFGFHILHVLDKRKSRGEIEVAHIMVAQNNKKLTGTPKQKINELNKQLKEGAKFSDLAKQFSDDQGSANKGGLLERFGSGKISDLAFEEAAFSLNEIGEVSKPIQSKYGWHLIKLINKYPVQPLSVLKYEIAQKVRKDSRSKIVNDLFYTKLKKRYSYVESPNGVANLLKVIDQSFLGGKTSKEEKNKSTLFSFADKKYTYADYYKYLRSKITGYKNLRNIEKVVRDSFSRFVNEKLYAFQDENLENEYEDFAAIMQEYRGGLLIFDLMETEVWQKAKNDTIGLKKYYDNNKQNYIWSKRIEGIIVSSSKKMAAKKSSIFLKDNLSIKEIKNKIPNSVVSEGIFETTDKEIPAKLKFKKGVSKIYKQNNQFIVVKINSVLLPSQKKYEDVKGRVINDYQEQIEKDWIKSLKKKYPVIINKDVLKNIKSQL